MRAIDTNVLVRLIVRDDAAQVAAAENFIKQGAWVSVLALAEAAWVLATVYDTNSKDLAKVIAMLLDHKNLALQDREAVADALSLFRARPSLGFSDCLMLALARKAGHLPLGTFDHRFSRSDGTEEL